MSDFDRLNHRPFSNAISSLKKALKKQRIDSLFKPSPTQNSLSVDSVDDESSGTEWNESRDPAPSSVSKDMLMFQHEMQGIQPLNRNNYIPPQREAALAPPRDEEAEVMAELADLISGRAVFDFSESDEYIEGIAQGLDRRLLKSLRQGTFAVQAHLDLHGKTRIEAHQLVTVFITDSRQRGRRCVLIVHGRGLNSKDQIPVLKESLKVWLARGRIGKSVLAFCSARPNDGGAGAVYVLLRK